MKEYEIDVYKVNTGEIIDTFTAQFTTVEELHNFMENETHDYDEPYYNLFYDFNLV